MSWAVLPWNRSAIDFYRRIGAEKVTDWDTFRLAGKAFNDLSGADGRSG